MKKVESHNFFTAQHQLFEPQNRGSDQQRGKYRDP